MKVEVRMARRDEVARFFCGETTEFEILRIGRKSVAMGCIATMPDGNTWGFLDVKPEAKRWPRLVVWALRRAIRKRGGEIRVVCHDDVHPGAPRLLTLIGFTPTEDMVGQRRVWVCQG